MPDEKIINRTIYFFELAYPGQNNYIILLPEGKDCCSNVNPKVNSNVKVLHIKSLHINEYVEKSSIYDSIIVHYLSLDAALFINKISHPNIYWIEW